MQEERNGRVCGIGVASDSRMLGEGLEGRWPVVEVFCEAVMLGGWLVLRASPKRFFVVLGH